MKNRNIIASDSNHNNTKLASIISWVTAAIALIVALSPPMAYYWITYEAHHKEVSLEAKVHAAFITQVIIGSPDTWREEVGELLRFDLTGHSENDHNEVRCIKTTDGKTIAQTNPELSSSAIIGSTPLIDANGVIVAELSVSYPLKHIVNNTWLVTLFSFTLAFAIFLTLRMLPLRALKRALSALHHEKQTLKDSEERLHIVIDNAIDAIITLDDNYIIESFNPASEQIFDYSKSEIIGSHINTLITIDSYDFSKNNKDTPLAIDKVEIIAKRKDGSNVPIEFSLNEVKYQGNRKFISSLRNITERKSAQEKLTYLANHDSLTGLPNRILLIDRLGQAIKHAHRNNKLLAVMFLDLDRFKNINDSLGHDVGDMLLKHVANVLKTTLRSTDTISRLKNNSDIIENIPGTIISRLGGDEFIIVLEKLASTEAASTVANKILEQLTQSPFMHGNEKIHISSSIGVSIYPTDSTDLNALIKQADIAMYRSKDTGRNTYNFFTEDLNTEISKRLSLEADLRQAIDNDEFELFYQPKAIASDKQIFGAEALIRWRRPEIGIIPPFEFIPILEETGLILPVGQWVIETACKQCREWLDQGLGPIHVAVNLSARQFYQQDLDAIISNALSNANIPAEFLELEITESLLMEDRDCSIKTLHKLKQMGLTISIDDFGTGYSSLSYLKRFPIDTLKIDQSFIRDITTDPDDAVITTAIISLAHSLRLNVIAEGVETQEHLDFLIQNECDQVQGYFLSRPMSANEFQQWITQYKNLNEINPNISKKTG